METALLILYICVFLLLCAALVRAMKGNRTKDWYLVFAGEALAAGGAICAMFLFNALPGKGMAPGLTWFAEVFYSMGAAALYLLLLVVSVVICAIKEWKGR